MPPANQHPYRRDVILKLLADGRERSTAELQRETGFGKGQVIETLGKMLEAEQLTRRPGTRSRQLYSIAR